MYRGASRIFPLKFKIYLIFFGKGKLTCSCDPNGGFAGDVPCDARCSFLFAKQNAPRKCHSTVTVFDPIEHAVATRRQMNAAECLAGSPVLMTIGTNPNQLTIDP
jgi:hypothetical protein